MGGKEGKYKSAAACRQASSVGQLSYHSKAAPASAPRSPPGQGVWNNVPLYRPNPSPGKHPGHMKRVFIPCLFVVAVVVVVVGERRKLNHMTERLPGVRDRARPSQVPHQLVSEFSRILTGSVTAARGQQLSHLNPASVSYRPARGCSGRAVPLPAAEGIDGWRSLSAPRGAHGPARFVHARDRWGHEIWGCRGAAAVTSPLLLTEIHTRAPTSVFLGALLARLKQCEISWYSWRAETPRDVFISLFSLQLQMSHRGKN